MRKKLITLTNNIIRNEDKFRQVFMQYYAPLCAVSNVYVKDINKAEDLVQQVFLHMWETNALQRIDSSLKGYLFSAVRNASVNFVKRDQSYKSLQFDQKIEAEAQYTLDLLLDNERTRILEEALQSLNPQNRVAFELVHLEELSYAEAALRLNISVNTVKYHLKTAIQVLRSSPLLKSYFANNR